jgi:TrmH family RNA methyltransferase
LNSAVSQRERFRRVASAQNSLIKDLRRAFARGEAVRDGLHAIEGVRLIEEAIRAGAKVHALVVSEDAESRAERLLPQLSAQAEVVAVPAAVFAGVVATETPQGVAALVKAREHSLAEVLAAPAPLILVAAGLQDPGNLGTLMRSADAFGAAGVLIGENTVGAFNPKAVRASAGSVFRLPVFSVQLAALLPELRARGVRCMATSSHKGTPLHEADLRGAVAVFIGNEGAGLGREVLREMNATIAIPHAREVESLNAGIAGSIVLYEASRQRA